MDESSQGDTYIVMGQRVITCSFCDHHHCMSLFRYSLHQERQHAVLSVELDGDLWNQTQIHVAWWEGKTAEGGRGGGGEGVLIIHVSQSTSQSISQSMSQPISQSINQSVNESTNQSVNQSTNQ